MARKRTSGTLHVLTVRQVQTAGDGDHQDGGGLLLRVRGESAAWVFRYTSPSGRRREMGLGVVLRGSPRQAGDSLTGTRDAAHKARDLLRQGLDPIDERDAGKVRKREAEQVAKAAKAREHWTLCRAARDYHERAIEPTKTTKHSADWINSLENHLPAELWNAPIVSITPRQVLAALTKVAPHERARNFTGDWLAETVKRMRQRLDAVFEDAIFHERCTANPAAAVRRKMTESASKAKPGQLRALPYREAPALLQRVREAQGTAARCLELAVLTVARTGEVLEAAWAEFDLDGGVWVVPGRRMKGGEDHAVHLPPRAVEVIRGQLGQHETWVFPSPMSQGRVQVKALSNMSILTLLDRMGMRDRTTVHGLCRATFSTWAYETAAARPDVIEACLAHREADKVKAAYNRAQFTDERKALLQAWAYYLARPAAQVIAMETRAG
jgi:integrase